MTRIARLASPALLIFALGCEKPAAPEAPAPAAESPAPAAKTPAPAVDTPKAAAVGDGAKAFDTAMAGVVEPYLKIQDTLSRDTIEGVAEAARGIAKAAEALDPKGVTGEHAGHYADVPTKLKAGALAVAGAGDLDAARAAFKTLSMPMGMWATMAKPAGLDLVYCSMTKGSWLQKTGEIRNPYHGAEMLACGEVVSGPGKAP